MRKENNQIYIVEKDDTIDKIASKYNKNPVEILIKNSISPGMIKEGLVLYID